MRIDIFGLGTMGGAIYNALVCKDYNVVPHDKDKEKEEKALEKCKKSVKLDTKNDVLLLAVKPSVFRAEKEFFIKNKFNLVISIMAGISISELTDAFGEETAIARLMPNIGATLNSSVTAISFSKNMSEEKKEITKKICNEFGSVHEIEEKNFSVFTALSGSGIAYILEMIDGMALSGVKCGLSYNEAAKIVAETMESAAKLALFSGKSVCSLSRSVCSPQGTTISGLATLKEKGFDSAVISAVEEAYIKSQNISKEKN